MDALGKVFSVGAVTLLGAALFGSIADAAGAPEWAVGALVGAIIMAGLFVMADRDF